MTHIVYIHGANATPTSFNFIKSLLPAHNMTDVVYNAHEPLDRIVSQVEATMLSEVGEPYHIVAHSLGGIIAVALSQRGNNRHMIKSISTMSTPFGGSEVAAAASVLMPFNTFLRNISTHSPTLREIVSIGPVVPTMNIVTTAGGTVFESRPNDGVVTIASQLEFDGTLVLQVELNHFEVLLSPTVAAQIERFVLSNN